MKIIPVILGSMFCKLRKQFFFIRTILYQLFIMSQKFEIFNEFEEFSFKVQVKTDNMNI